MEPPFVYVHHGKIDPDSIGKDGEVVLVFAKAPDAALRKKILTGCPRALTADVAWKGATLTAGSNGSFDVDVIDEYGSEDERDDGMVSHETAEALGRAVEAWARKVDAIAKLRAVVGPGRIEGFDAWDDWSRDQLSRSPVPGLESYARKAAAPTSMPVSDRAYAKALAKITQYRGKKVDVFDLSEMGLTRLPPELWNLDIRTWLMLDDNQLTSLPREVVHLKNLKKLIVRGNPLKELPAEIGSMKLRGLELGLSLGGVSDVSFVCGMTALEELDLRGLARLPKDLGKLANLESLALGHAKLEGLEAIWGLTGLRSLEISDAGLEELPAGIGRLTNLTSLYLSGNKLRSLPASLRDLPKLKSLDLEKNPALGLPKPMQHPTTRKGVLAALDRCAGAPAGKK